MNRGLRYVERSGKLNLGPESRSEWLHVSREAQLVKDSQWGPPRRRGDRRPPWSARGAWRGVTHVRWFGHDLGIRVGDSRGRKTGMVQPGPDPDSYPPIDPTEPVPDDPGELSPDTPETLPPAPVEPMPGPDDPDSVPA